MGNCSRMRPDRSVWGRWPMTNRSTPNRPPAKLRCAIYTRKSSEEGLEQDFNSLDAQREACEAFIASQKREGWALVGEMYDDGGFSGATMERPAFQRLLSDVSAGKISSAREILPSKTFTSGSKASAHLCAPASRASKST